jgi:energy-coupling factor transporter ATP-binding protein EcfA2
VNSEEYKSEIRSSIIRDLLEKARKGNYSRYLASLRLERIRFFQGALVNLDFPVTALIGPNGGGKSTILGAAACAYSSFKPETFFQRSRVGDDHMDDWRIEYEIIDRDVNPKGTIRSITSFKDNQWSRDVNSVRRVRFFSINRTVPIAENSSFSHKRRLRVSSSPDGVTISTEAVEDIANIKTEAERILGKSLAHFRLLRLKILREKRSFTRSPIVGSFDVDDEGNKIPIFRKKLGAVKTVESEKLFFVGSDGENEYSEFNFGAGEASVIHLVADAESLPDYSLILIEEIENGLHPVAVRRLVEYFIDVAFRKKLQVIFTTHSDQALTPLPPEGIWASIDGTVQQGKLSIEMLRVVSGRIDKRLAIFVEDEFAKSWIKAVLREKLSAHLDEIAIYPVFGDGNAVNVQRGHMVNPAIRFHSICFVDGDSRQIEDPKKHIFRMPGANPELTIFNSVFSNLERNIAFLTIALQRAPDKQGLVSREVRKVSQTNRDPHLLFTQVGLNIGFVPESIVRGAFLSIWIQENSNEAEKIVEPIKRALELPPKRQNN